MLLKDIENSGALQSTDNDLDDDEAQNFTAVWSHMLGYGSVIGLVANITKSLSGLEHSNPRVAKKRTGF